MTKTIDQRFEQFHKANPHIYRNILRLCRQFKAKGQGRIGIAMLIEVLRWNNRISTRTTEDYKITNDFKPLYARLIEEENPELKGIFEIKTMWRKDRS